MAKNNNLTDFVTDIADAIRAKCGTTGAINPQDFSKFVGGMPFFKLKETRDITSQATDSVEVSLSYDTVYCKGEVYLTNDHGLTEIPSGEGTAKVMASTTGEVVGSLNNTTDRLTLCGLWGLFRSGYIPFIEGNGEGLISAGWHMKIDIFELYIGNPNGKSTPMILNAAIGGGTL